MLEPIYKTLTSTETRSIWSILVFGNCHMPILPEKKKKFSTKGKNIFLYNLHTHSLSISFLSSLPFSIFLLYLSPLFLHSIYSSPSSYTSFSSPTFLLSLSSIFPLHPSLLLLALPFIPSLFCFFSTFPLLFSLSPLHEPSLRKNRNRGRSATSP